MWKMFPCEHTYIILEKPSREEIAFHFHFTEECTHSSHSLQVCHFQEVKLLATTVSMFMIIACGCVVACFMFVGAHMLVGVSEKVECHPPLFSILYSVSRNLSEPKTLHS